MRKTTKSMLMLTAMGLSISACSNVYNSDAPEAEAASVATATAEPREGLSPGVRDAGVAIENLNHIHSLPAPPGFYDPSTLWSPAEQRALAQAIERGEEVDKQPSPISFANSDLAFSGNKVIMGNFHGFNIFEAPEGGTPEHILSVVCPGGQGDVTVHGNLVFYSVEQNRGRLDCGAGGVEGASSAERFRGVRIFDISDISAPVQVAAVQTCRGSHTHTLVPHPSDDNTLYIYNSGTAGVRPGTELEGCSGGQPEDDPDTALYSIDVIKVPLDAPEKAAIVNRPRIFADKETGEVNGLWKGGALTEGAQRTSATNACHDITVYPEFNLAAGACSGNGILLDISDPENPARIDEISDPNMAYWHSATFANDASKILFTDEWSGGIGPRCTAKDPETWGADLVADLTDEGMVARGFFKIPGVQTEVENCVAHNGSLVPVPGRDIMVQGWYSGGLSVVDFTDSENVFEIAYFDRGPVNAEELYLAGFWAAYWHNGRIFAPEIVRGLDIFTLKASEHLSEAEIAAAGLINFDEANTQTQLHFKWPNKPVVARAYLDQLARGKSVNAGLMSQIGSAIDAWESGNAGNAKSLASALKAAASKVTGNDASRLTGLAEMFANAS